MKKTIYSLSTLLLFSFFISCENTDEQHPNISIDAKDKNINIDAKGIKDIADSGANINISKSGNVSINGKNIGVNVDSTGVNVKMNDGKAIEIDSNKIKVNIGGIKVNIQK